MSFVFAYVGLTALLSGNASSLTDNTVLAWALFSIADALWIRNLINK